MNCNRLMGLLLMSMLVLAGCATPYGLEESGQTGADGGAVYGEDGYTIPGQSTAYGNNIYNAQASTGDFYEDPAYGLNVVGGPQSTAKDRVIYFAYDSARLDSRSEAVVREHAAYLRNNPKTRVVLEGHTDERGSREYNVGLGERRAYSVKHLFEQEGVSKNQMRVLSYGEERPATWCSNEQCYAKNRRVVIIY